MDCIWKAALIIHITKVVLFTMTQQFVTVTEMLTAGSMPPALLYMSLFFILLSHGKPRYVKTAPMLDHC